MGLQDFKIYLDNPHATYYPGQSITGRVVVILDSPKKYRGIKLTMKGKAKTHWTTHESVVVDGRRTTKTVHHTGHQEYFKEKSYLIGSPSGEQIELPPGKHAYPFNYVLSSKLPSSFESDYGFIRYSAKAALDRPWKIDNKSKVPFKVESHLDLNQQPTASNPVNIEESKTFGCLWCASMPLSVNILLPVRGYVPNQTIPIKVNVENQSGVAVDIVQIVLQKVVRYTATSPHTAMKVIKLIVAQVNAGPVGGNETICHEQSLNVPPLPHSSLGNCRIIDIEYKLKFEACVSGVFRKNLKGKTYILIGTIPLFNYQMPQPPTRVMDYSTISEVSSQGMHLSMPTPSAPIDFSNYSLPTSTLAPPTYEKAVYGMTSLLR